MSDSLERAVANAVVALLSKDATLAALPPKYAVNDDGRESPMIRVAATKGEFQQEGPQGFAVEVTVTVRSNEEDADQLDDLCARADAAIETPDTAGVDLSFFSVLIIEPEQSGDWQSDDDSRTRTRTYPFIVKAA